MHATTRDPFPLLVGGIAHDFNNLVGGVIGHAAMAQALLPPGHPAAEHLAAIQNAGRRAAALARQIVDHARHRRPTLKRQAVAPVIVEAMSLLLPRLLPGQALATEGLQQPLELACDAGQLHEVVLNLLLNAQQALPAGGGWIAVRLRADEAANEALIEVEDNGCGIDAEARRRLFEPFFTTRRDGSGLGLPVVRAIVQAHGGQVAVRSEPGAGSCFTVHLPLAASAGGDQDLPTSVTGANGRHHI